MKYVFDSFLFRICLLSNAGTAHLHIRFDIQLWRSGMTSGVWRFGMIISIYPLGFLWRSQKSYSALFTLKKNCFGRNFWKAFSYELFWYYSLSAVISTQITLRLIHSRRAEIAALVNQRYKCQSSSAVCSSGEVWWRQIMKSWPWEFKMNGDFSLPLNWWSFDRIVTSFCIDYKKKNIVIPDLRETYNLQEHLEENKQSKMYFIFLSGAGTQFTTIFPKELDLPCTLQITK